MTTVRVFDPAMCWSSGVRAIPDTEGEAGLPVVKVNGEIRSSGLYPRRAELADWAGLGRPAARLATDPVSA